MKTTEKTNLLFLGAQFFASDSAENHDVVFEEEDLRPGGPEGGEAPGGPPAKPAGETPPAPGNEPAYTVKYNGEEKKLPLAELLANAQKGLNYDHVRQELELFRQRFREEGKNPEEPRQAMGGTSPENAAGNAPVLSFLRLLREYPDIAAETLPEQVALDISQGKDPLVSYQRYENRQLKSQLAALQQNLSNRRMSPGPAAGLTGEPSDSFLDGLFGK